MPLSNLLLFSTYFLISAIRDTLQDINEPIVHPKIIQLSDLVTSDDLVNLIEGFNSKNVHFDNFKLKPEALGNSFLVPLCEVKDQKGNEIKTEFIKFINFNQAILESSKIDNENEFFCTSVKFFNNDKRIYSGRSLPRRCFIFENPSTKKLFLYLLLTMIKSNKLHIQHNLLHSGALGVDSLSFSVAKNYDEPLGIFNAKLHDISERYVLVYTKKYIHISFFIKSTHDGTFELLYDNQKNEYAIIKPRGPNNEGNILKYNLVKENKHTVFSEEFLKQQENFSTDLKTDAKSEENSEYKLNLLRIDNQNSFKNKEELKEVNVSGLSTETEHNSTKEKLKLIEKDLKVTKEDVFIIEEKFKKIRKKLELSAEKIKTSEYEVKFAEEKIEKIEKQFKKIEEKIKTAKDAIKFTEEKIKTSEEELEFTTEKIISSNEKLKYTEEKIKTSEEELKYTTENIKTSKDELMCTEEKIHAFEEKLNFTEEKIEKTEEKLMFIEEKIKTSEKKLNSPQK
ncbi:hypothetical protein CDIK_3778 [Cucumispora dikerogammari]|nr:hypothetical protein CDIK_3778 [Cucumispora dikerogammari]